MTDDEKRPWVAFQTADGLIATEFVPYFHGEPEMVRAVLGSPAAVMRESAEPDLGRLPVRKYRFTGQYFRGLPLFREVS